MDTQILLKEYGLSEKEIAVYLSLINLGPSPVRSLSLESKVNRGTTYDILKNLISQGLVSYYNRESHQYFVAEPPEKLMTAVEQKQKDLELVKDKIKENLPELKLAFEREGGRPIMKLYEGDKGVKQILEDILSSVSEDYDNTYYVYASGTVDRRKLIYQAFPNFSKKRVAKGISVRTIVLGEGGELTGRDERKWVQAKPKDYKATHEIIYAGKVAHISLDGSDKPIAVLIENEAIFETQKLIFENLWGVL